MKERNSNQHLGLAPLTTAAATTTSVLDTNFRIDSHNKQVKTHHHNKDQNQEQESYYSDIIIYDHPAIAGQNIVGGGKITKISSTDKRPKKVAQLILIRLDPFKFAIMEPLQVDQRLIGID